MPLPHEPTNPSASENPIVEIKDILVPTVLKATQSLAMQVQSFDAMLWEIDQLLNDLHPPLTGKLRLWQDTKDPFQRYFPVRWRRSKADNEWKFDKKGWGRLPLRAMKAREFNDNYETVKDLLSLAVEVSRARANLIRVLTNFTQGCTERMKHAVPAGTKMRAQINRWKTERDAGVYRTWITKHNPVREGFEASEAVA